MPKGSWSRVSKIKLTSVRFRRASIRLKRCFMTFKDFKGRIDKELNSQHLREGQIIMNHLSSVWSDKYKEIVNTDLDCFYDDNKSQLLMDHLERSWTHGYR